MKELGVDEKVNRGREVLATTLASGRSNVSTVFNNLSKNVEKFREQRRSQDLANLQTQSQVSDETENVGAVTSPGAEKPPTTPVVAAGTPVLAEASTRAGAYLSSWASWAGEKRKKVFTQTPTASPPPETTEKSLPSLPADDPPPKKSFEESIFDARMRAAHAHSSSSSSVLSPQRTDSMSSSIHPATEVKDLDNGKGVGLGIVNLEPQSPLPVPVVGMVRLEGVESVLPSLPIQETDIPPPTPIKDEVMQRPSPTVERSQAPAPSNIELSRPAVLAVEEAVGISEPEPEIVSPIRPSLSFVRREVTPPMADHGSIQSPVPIEEKIMESSRSEPEKTASRTRRKVSLPEAGVEPIDQPAIIEEAAESPQPERVASPLPLMRRKMTLLRTEKVEPIEQFTAVEEKAVEKAVESLKPEPEVVASPPPSLPRMRKMTLSRAEKVKLIEQSTSVEEKHIDSQKPEPERVASPPPPSLPFMRRKMTLPRAEKVEPTEKFTAVEEKAVDSKAESEITSSHVPSLSWTKRKMTLSRVEKIEPAVESPKSDPEGVTSPLSSLPFSRKGMTIPQTDIFESTRPSISMEQKTVESQNPETERVLTPPPSLPFTRRRKMTIQRSEIVEPSRHFESVMEKAVQPLKPEQGRTKSPPPSVEKAEDHMRQGRLVQSRPLGPAVGQTEVTTVPESTERNRRSIPTFEKSQMKPPRSERTPEPVKIPEYTKAAPLEVRSAQEKTTEPIRVPRHSRAESAATSAGQPAPRPLRRAETQSAAMISKPSSESLTPARHSRSESSSSITSIDNNKPVSKTERVKGSIAERAKRFSQTQDEPSDNDNVSPARAAFAARRAMFEKK